MVLSIILSSLVVAPVMASESSNTDNFNFSDFTADYYLTRDEEGVSHLRVVENLTAEFPNYAQNKGLRRHIPLTNQGGKNITLPNLDSSNIKITRNGVAEPIWDISRGGDYYTVETGTDDYVLGTQKYTFEYEFEKVVTDFDDYQELYWDTNGNGWPQRFKSLKARLHFDAELLDDYFDNEAWCYVGKYGESDQSRCKITNLHDGFEFAAKNLGPYENLTFDVKIKPGTFVVPEPEESYALIIATIVLGVICGVLMFLRIVKNKKYSEKIKQYKSMFVAPQYQPNSKYGLIEMAEVYLGKKKDVKVGVLLEMLVEKKIELRKSSESSWGINKWELIVKNADKLTTEEELVLKLLKGGGNIANEDVFELKSHTATTELIKIGKQFDDETLGLVKEKGLVEKRYVLGSANSLRVKQSLTSNIFLSIFATFFLMMPILYIYEWINNAVISSGKIIASANICFYLSAAMIFMTALVFFWCGACKKLIAEITDEGLKASNYMEGLKLYIKMAEVDRMKVLQSVKGAEISGNGIVKIYEKLLPYAAIFGLEESWMKEMKDYCKINEISEPDYLLAGITAHELSRGLRTAGGYASNAGHSVAGGGSFSSSSSGSGGGGFSGGGGGGGGGGGR